MYTSGIAAGIVVLVDLEVGSDGVIGLTIVGTMQRSLQSFAFGLVMCLDKSIK